MNKKRIKLKSWFLYVHAIIMGLLSWILVPSCNFGLWALSIAVSHFVIDAIKIYCSKGMWGFVIDQLLHLGILVAISTVYETEQYPHKVDSGKYQVGESESCDNIKNAGALIGNLERMLTIVFVILGQFEAIGFIVADKSILRFKDTDTAKTEYVLAGTFLSFGIAILFGLMVTM